MTVTTTRPDTGLPRLPRSARKEQVALFFFVVVPFVAVFAAVPVLWGRGIGWVDVAIFFLMYIVAGLGITVGFHRYFTHGSFKAKRPLRIALAVMGSLAIEGPVIRWVSDHRRHHAFSDVEGDPHSPHRFGPGVWNLTKGLFYAHLGWLFAESESPQEKYSPDLLADSDIKRIDGMFPAFVAITLAIPLVIGGLVTWSWQGALTAFFWGGLVRVGLLHHITWSINSVCHVFGETPFKTRDRSRNFWPLALMSFGESWHNLHHADPTCARHGVDAHQWDSSARVIRWFEQVGWAYDVRWPNRERLAARRAA
ncbi:MAG: acyl-CoA desaturase [Mycobacteriales bacterium]